MGEMLGNVDFEKIQKRYLEYWAKENHDRPLMDVRAPKYDYRTRLKERPGSLEEQWLDTEYVLKKERAILEATCFLGEAYPLMNPNLGPDVFGAYFGCGLTFGEETSWASDHFQSLEEIDCGELKKDNFWLQKTVELTEAMAENSRGDYLTGITDLHAGLDGLVSLRGPEALCFDLFEEPELVKEKCAELGERFKEVYQMLDGILARYQKGNSNWLGVYHPEGWYVTSCDFIGMISENMYREFAEPELKREIEFFQHTIFHLDGPGALRHLDALLEQPGINGIEWVYGAGQPSAAHWIWVLKRIQEAGKMIHIDILPQDLPVLLEELRPEGVLYRVNCQSVEEAETVMRMAEKGTF